MSSPYSYSTGIAEVVVVPNGSKHFEEKLIEIVSLSGNTLTPIRQRIWMENKEENISEASVLIAISGQFVARHNTEDLAESLSERITEMLGRITSSLLETQTVLICDQEDDVTITAFCFVNKINKNIYFTQSQEADGERYVICRWSKYRHTFFTKHRKLNGLPM